MKARYGPHQGRTMDTASPAAGGGAADSGPRQRQTLRSLLPYLWPPDEPALRRRVLLALAALIAAKLVTVIIPFFFKAAVDALTPQLSGGQLAATVAIAMVMAYGVARLAMLGFTQLRDALFASVGQHATRRVAVRTFTHVHALSMRFHLERRTGGLSRIIARGTSAIDSLLRLALFNSGPTVIELVLVCGILTYYFNVWYAVVTLVMVACYAIYTLGATDWRLKFRRAMNESDTEATTRAVDSLLNFETVKYFGTEHYEAQRYDKSLAGYEKAAVSTMTSLAVLNVGQGVIFTVGLVIAMIMSSNDIAAGRATVGDLVMVNAFLIQLYQPLNVLGMVYREIKQALIDLETMFDLIAVAPEVVDVPQARELTISGGEICFEKVSFAYDQRREVLHEISFRVPPGQSLAIVGASGAGKSTISRLLYRFYDLQHGRILVDGQDISQVTQQSLRAAIGIVPQDTVLFNDTIRYNIGYGRIGASDTEIERAAQLAQIHGFVNSLPDGYASLVGERGLKLSGGEKQRVAIARTILKDPPILLLDEATSALDSHTEKEIQSALETVAKNRTTLMIAHRLSTVIDADEILVLDAGRIVERGRHAELLALGGRYASLWERQRHVALVEAELEEARSDVRDSDREVEATR